MLKFKKLSSKASAPTRGSKEAVGYDLCSAEDLTIKAMGKALISTDLSFSIPIGHYGRIAPRSGMSWKKHTDIGAGVIDPDYRGNVKVVLFNHSEKPIEVHSGDRIAQLILEKVSVLPLEEIKELNATQRGENGFGSTGI